MISGVSSNLYSKRFDFFTELQRIESWENIPLQFHWLAVDSVKFSFLKKISTIPTFAPMHREIQGFRKSSQSTTQNPKRRRPLCVED